MAKTVKKVKENVSTTNEHGVTISLQDHDAKIAELAYYKAENRGFEAGYEHEDWFAAEQELDSIMSTDHQTSSLTIADISSDVESKVVSANNAGEGHDSVALANLTTTDNAVKSKAAIGKSIAVKAVKDKAM